MEKDKEKKVVRLVEKDGKIFINEEDLLELETDQEDPQCTETSQDSHD